LSNAVRRLLSCSQVWDLGGLAAIVLLLGLQLFGRTRLAHPTHRLLLLIGLFFLPGTVLTAATFSMLEETKEVNACGACHVMGPFVRDLQDPQSETLAARHFLNKWIPEHQCYSCHTTYGFQGTMRAKLGGLRHWLVYSTRSWKEPIRHHGTYANANCLVCHGDTPKYSEVEVHTLGAAEIASNEASCISCHGPPHPEPEARKAAK
jgi:nitrate/TMAO reductase-like tetraheme cytochrome c subunit